MSLIVPGSKKYNCIYCGKEIPSDVGLSCAKCAAKGSSWKDYNQEIKFGDENDPVLAAEIKEYEAREKHENSDTQTKEEFARLYEGNVESRRQYRFANQDELKARREGHILHMNDFMRRLKSCGLNAWYTNKGGMARTLGLYVQHEGLKPSCTHLNGEPHYVGFVQVPFMQEYEELHFDRYDVPLGIKRRGWRTLGLKLIEQQLIAETKFHEVFGEPSSGVISQRYRAYLKYLRNKPQGN